MTPDSQLASLVAALPEAYQPVYAHPELSSTASRACEDRWHQLRTLYLALEQDMGRSLRVLDLGCAQGFFSLSLGELGASILGVDHEPANIRLCTALLGEHSGFDVRFEEAAIEEVLVQLAPNEYDLVLGLSVFHHLCHQHGKETVRDWVSVMATKVTAAVFELALASEPLYWSSALPSDERDLLEGFRFVHELSSHGTHLSETRRPLFVCSNQVWFLGGSVHRMDGFMTMPHALAGDVHQGTRRYYLGGERTAKVFRLTASLGAVNRTEIEREAAFLSAVPKGFQKAPLLFGWGIAEQEAWLVREALPGELLVDLILAGRPYDEFVILNDVLDQLSALESDGLYHSDVRVWNVIVASDGHAALVDFGAISRNREDCVWPWDPFLSFLTFARDVVTHRVGRATPFREPFISPYNLPPPYAQWAMDLWRQPTTAWSFRRLKEGLAQRDEGEELHLPDEEPHALWMKAVEQYLELSASHAHRLESELAALRQEGDDLSRLSNALEQASQLVDELAERSAAERRIEELATQLLGESAARAQAEARVEELELRLVRAEGLHAEMEVELNETRQRLAGVEQGLLQAQAVRQGLELQISWLHASTSWRATAPFRAAMNGLRAVPGVFRRLVSNMLVALSRFTGRWRGRISK